MLQLEQTIYIQIRKVSQEQFASIHWKSMNVKTLGTGNFDFPSEKFGFGKEI